MVLVGPSGCGKSTALRMLAGLEEISEGEIRIGDRIVNDLHAEGPGHRDGLPELRALPAHDGRREPRLRPQAPQDVRSTRSRSASIVAAKTLQIEEYLKRKPRALSGGQRQRVAMGRAIVREPQAFLMDEPLSNLDAKLRVQMRAEIHQLQRRLGVTTIYVTHDQVEAMTMGDRVAVMNAGHLQQVDTPQVLYDQPANEFVAGFIGSPSINLVEAQLAQSNGKLEVVVGEHRLTVDERLARNKVGPRGLRRQDGDPRDPAGVVRGREHRHRRPARPAAAREVRADRAARRGDPRPLQREPRPASPRAPRPRTSARTRRSRSPRRRARRRASSPASIPTRASSSTPRSSSRSTPTTSTSSTPRRARRSSRASP